MSEKSLITCEFRVSYPAVFVPKLNDLSGKNEYSLVALFPLGADISNLRKAALEAIKERWGEEKSKWPKKMKSPFRDQAEREIELDDGRKVMPDGYERGAIFINLKSTRQPGIIDANRNPILDAETFYAGCYARASVSCYAFDKKGNQGVAFGLSNIQKIRDGEPFSGRRKAEDEFSPIETSPDSSTSGVDPFAE